LSNYSKKDDYDTPTRLLAGPNFTEIAPEGLHLMDNLHHFRNGLIALIANHPSDTLEGGIVHQYLFDTTLIEDPDFLLTEGDRESFARIVDSIIDFEIEENKLDPLDAETVRNIYVRMTIPRKVMNHGEEYPWIFGQFDHAPIVAASAVMTSVRSDVLQVQTLASQLVSSRVEVESFNFNKIDPLAFSATSYINQGDSLGLRVMIAAYDSSEAMELKYWVDDTNQVKKKESEQDLANMKTFKGNAGQKVNITGSVGDHILSGFIAIKEKGVKKWKPWKFNYSVGAPNAAVSAADLQVLYIGWKNRIKVSASGYKPESIKLSGRGCTVRGPDSKGFYIATVSNPKLKKANLIVSGVDDKGKTNELANEVFRVFSLPKPTAYFAGKAGGNLKKANAVSYKTLKASLGESPLDVPYEVVSFTMFTTKGGAPIELNSKTNRLTKNMLAAMKKIPKNGSLTFTRVKVKGPSGRVSLLDGGIVLKLI
jgi:gliding motility-associated protein GldM